MTANEAQIEGTGEKVNLFDYHVKADTILFQYTTPDGRDEVVKFPLTGFCGNYLQFTHVFITIEQPKLIRNIRV